MIRIAICDDIPGELEKISAAMESYARRHAPLGFAVDRYAAAMEILSAAEKDRSYDIVILDICMPGILGTEVARDLLLKSPDTSVIFLTTSREYAVEAFSLGATHYLLKPFTQAEFDEALDRAVGKLSQENYVSLNCVDGMYRMRVKEIVYIESQSHYLALCPVSGELLRLRGSLSGMYEMLQEYPEFIRVGASYIVNLNLVRKVSSVFLEMQDNTRIPVPRRSREAVQKAYMEFCRREAVK